jgi:hypothetical protein
MSYLEISTGSLEQVEPDIWGNLILWLMFLAIPEDSSSFVDLVDRQEGINDKIVEPRFKWNLLVLHFLHLINCKLKVFGSNKTTDNVMI